MKKLVDYFKDKKHAMGTLYVHPFAAFMLMDMLMFISAAGQKAEVTSFIRDPSENRSVGAKGTSHVDGRSWDLHCKSWTKTFRKEFETHFERKYKGQGAISGRTGLEDLVVMHGKDENFHCHVQLSREYSSPDCWRFLE
jgi:hypothetical protein